MGFAESVRVLPHRTMRTLFISLSHRRSLARLATGTPITRPMVARFVAGETLAEALPASLPYGTQRRIEIARAMAARPRVLLLDEPAAGLNAPEIGELAAIVRDIRDSGVTVILIEHNMGLVMSLCDYVTVLDAGKVIAQGTPATVTRHTAVITAYLGDASLFDEPAEVSENDARH